MIDITTKKSTDKKKKERDAPNRHDSKDNKKSKIYYKKNYTNIT